MGLREGSNDFGDDTVVCSGGDSRICRLCGTSELLTIHHLLKKRSARLIGRNQTILLCRECHDRLHSGEPELRADAYRELRQVLSSGESDLLNDPLRIPELWETKLSTGGSAATKEVNADV